MKATTLLLVTLFSAVSCFDASKYATTQELDPKYRIHWTKDGQFMNLALEVQTTGWVGFGIGESTSGSMPGADIVMATVKDGVTSISDRYATAKEMPLADDCSDWILVNGEESNGKTIIELRRAIDTGDKQDRPFEDSNKVIVAFGRTDNFEQHTWRLAIQVNFWPADNSNHRTVPTGFKFMEYVSNNYIIPTVKTTYADFYHNVTVDTDVHGIAFEPIFVNATQKYIHHFVIFASEVFANSGKSLDSSWSVLWAWAPGIAPFVFPSNVGMRFGPNGYKSIRFQIHYDNVNHDVGVSDTGSGVRIYYTDTLRQFDAGVLETGDIFVRNPSIIPQGTERSSFEYSCPSDCSKLFPGPLNVFQVFLHMHQVGAQMWGTQWTSNGTFIRETNRVDFYDFAFQQHTPREFKINPGDRINTHCVYQQQTTGPVRFGTGSEEEMCVQYMFYYPRYSMQYCGFYQANKSADVSTNVTMCSYTPMANLPNPDIRDPSGGEFVKFGKENPAGSCKASSTAKPESTKAETDTGMVKSNFDDVESSALMVTFSVVTLLIAVLI